MLHQGNFKTFINEKHLGHTECYEHVGTLHQGDFKHLSMNISWDIQNIMDMVSLKHCVSNVSNI